MNYYCCFFREEFDTKSKMRHDPMLDMMKLVDTTRKVEEKKDNKHKYQAKVIV